MEPVSSAPSLGSVNGIGLTMYGKRDVDASGAYTKTRFFVIFFLPVLAIDAWRVQDAGGDGWYFLAKVRLSKGNRFFNFALLAIVAGLIISSAIESHQSDPGVIAGEQMDHAAEARERGDLAPAVRMYAEVLNGATEHVPAAKEAIQAIIDEDLASAAPAEVAMVLSVVATETRHAYGEPFPGHVLFAKGWSLLKPLAASDPGEVFLALDGIAGLAAEGTDIEALRLPILEALVAKEPKNVHFVSRLAAILEKKEDFDRCRALLEPVKDGLGAEEGARVLGEIYAREERHAEAIALLQPYVKSRLERLHAAEKAHEAAATSAREGAIFSLQNGYAPQHVYRQLEGLSDEAQGELVAKYVFGIVDADESVIRTRKSLQEVSGVVPVAFSLGISLLRRARSIPDAQARQKQLEAAEKVFLAIGGAAGESEQYRLFLGQVYYWMGKQDEGGKLFDQVLASSSRGFEQLMGVASVLREVGDEDRARTLMDEAYAKASSDEQRQSAAGLRAFTAIDRDDEIEWLQKTDKTNPGVAAALASARGYQALEKGDAAAAEPLLRDALKRYRDMPETAASLNNGALAADALFRVTGAISDQQTYLKMVLAAEKLDPNDSILLLNVAEALISQLVLTRLNGSVGFAGMPQRPSFGDLGLLYQDAGGRQAVIDALAADQYYPKLRAHLERLMVVMPKNPRTWSQAIGVAAWMRDHKALDGIAAQLPRAALDLTRQAENNRRYYDKENAAELVADYLPAVNALRGILKRGGAGNTAAAAAVQLVDRLPFLSGLGESVSADEVVSMARTAYKTTPSAATGNALRRALMFRASLGVAKSNRTFATRLAATSHILTETTNLFFVALSDPALAAVLKANKDFRAALKLVHETLAAFPEDLAAHSWAAVRIGAPDSVAALEARIKADERFLQSYKLTNQLSPSTPEPLVSLYLAHLALGEIEAAKAVLEGARAGGMPL